MPPLLTAAADCDADDEAVATSCGGGGPSLKRRALATALKGGVLDTALKGRAGALLLLLTPLLTAVPNESGGALVASCVSLQSRIQRFLMDESVRPGSSAAIWRHLHPKRRTPSSMIRSSSAVHI